MSTQPLTCDLFDAMLPDYLDDSVDADTCAALEAHAASCSRCAPLLAELSALTRDARALPDLAPARDLWPDIAARLETPVVQLPGHLTSNPAAGHNARPRFLTAPWLAAAAAVLVVATASVTVVAMRARNAPVHGPLVAQTAATPGEAHAPNAVAVPLTGAGQPDSGSSPAATVAAPAAPAPRVLAASAHRPAAVPVERIYAREIAQLDSIVHDRHSQLDSTTIAVVEKNLQIIDRAIAQSRAALAHDPNSGFLHDQLNNALDQKIALLRTVALLPART